MSKEDKYNALVSYIKDKYNWGNQFTIHCEQYNMDWVEYSITKNNLGHNNKGEGIVRLYYTDIIQD